MEDVCVTVGGIKAVNTVSLELGHIPTALLGGNGSGKTSLINAVCGAYPVSSGSISLLGRPVTGLRTSKIMARGLARSMQSVASITTLSALEYVALGVAARPTGFDETQQLRVSRSFGRNRAERKAAHDMLEQFYLGRHAHTRLQDLPYGVRKMVDVVRVFASNPTVVLLDEPTSGIGARERHILARLISEWLQATAASMLLIDHDLEFVARLCPRAYVLSAGRVISHGDLEDVLVSAEVQETFLGNAGDPKDDSPTTRSS